MIALPQRNSSFRARGVAHILIAVPTDEVRQVRVNGVTTHFMGEGQNRIIARRGSGPLHSHYQGRMDEHIERARMEFGAIRKLTFIEGYRGNAFVNQGLQDVLDSAYGDLTADRITHIGLSADDQAVTAATTSLDPAGGATGTSIKVTANTSRTNQTVSTDQTWTQADVAFAIKKIGLLSSSAETDVCNIIGGTGGSSPYNEPFTIDLTSIATWTLTMGIDVTATAS